MTANKVRLAIELAEQHPDFWSVKQIAAALEVNPQTLGSYFFRRGLPSLKQRIVAKRLRAIAARTEAVSRIFYDVGLASRQSAYRFIRKHRA